MFATTSSSPTNQKETLMFSTHVSPPLQDKRELIKAPPGVSTCQCQSCGEFYPETLNPDGYGKSRSATCAHCGVFYEYPDSRVIVRPDSWSLLDEDIVKQATWFHATTRKGWMHALESDSRGIPLVHLGTCEASQDIVDYHKRNRADEIFLYSLRLREGASVSPDFLVDENSWDDYVDDGSWADRDTVYRYVNDAESPGSISLFVPAGTFTVKSLTIL